MPPTDAKGKDSPISINNGDHPDLLTPDIPQYTIHKSYWLLQVSYFLLFLSFNCVQNLSSTLVGDEAMIAICILYAFYIISNLLTPVILSYFKNDSARMQAWGSVSYTLFIFAFFLAMVDASWALYPTAVFIGLSGGLVWVGNGVFLTSLSSHIAEEACARAAAASRLADGLTDVEAPSAVHPPTDVGLNSAFESIKSAAVGTMMSVQWGVMNLNTIVGALIAFFVLGSDSSSNSVDADKAQVRVLFIVFTIVAGVANLCYFLTARIAVPSIPTPSADKPLRKVWRTLCQAAYVTKQPVVALCIPQYLASAMCINFAYSGFTGTAVKVSLGATNVSLVIICVCLFNIAAALGVNRFLGTLRSSRLTALAGCAVQIVFFVVLLAAPYEDWPTDADGARGSTAQWMACLCLAALAGVGDGAQAVSLNTTLAHLVSNDPNTRAPAFSVLQCFKGLGSVLLFLLSAVTSYYTQLYVTMSVLLLGVAGQVAALFAHGVIMVEVENTAEVVKDVELADEPTPEQLIDMDMP